MPWNNITTYTTGQLATAAVWEDMVENMNYLEELNYTEFSSDKNITATTAPTADLVVSAGAITFEAVPHLIEFQCTYAQPDTGAANRQVLVTLWEGSTDLGTIAQVRTPASAILFAPIHNVRRLTPTAAAHTYSIKAWVNAGTAVIGATSQLPGFIRITRVPV